MTGLPEYGRGIYRLPDKGYGGVSGAGQHGIEDDLDKTLGLVSPRLLDLVFMQYVYNSGFIPRHGLLREQRTPGTQSDRIQTDNLQPDLGFDTQLALITVFSAARYKVTERISDPSNISIFDPATDKSLRQYMHKIADTLDPIRYGERGMQFLSRTAELMNMALRTNNTLQPKLIFQLCTDNSDHSINRFGIFQTMFPEIHQKVLSALIIPSQMEPLSRAPLRSKSTRLAIQRLAGVEKTVQVQDVLLDVLNIQEQAATEGSDEPIQRLGFLLKEAITALEYLSPSFQKSVDPKSDTPDYRLIYELAIMGALPKDLIHESAKAIQQENIALRLGKEPDPKLVESLLHRTDLLIDPKEFGLTPDEALSRLIRRHVPIKHLSHSGDSLSPGERETRWERVLFISPEVIRKNPEAYFRYQMALVKAIAEQLGIQQDKNVLVPIPKIVKSENVAIFRSQEAEIKALPDDQYLLLYASVQQAFYELLPFCGVPPYHMVLPYQTPDKDIVVPHLSFAWEKPPPKEQERTVTGVVINHLPFLNYADLREFKLHRQIKPTIPGEFLQSIMVKHGADALIIHGLARAFISEGGMNHVTQDDYMAMTIDQALRIPQLDVDIVVFGDIDIGQIAFRTAARHRDLGVTGGFRRTFSLRTDAGYISKKQLKKIKDLLNPAQHPSTFCQAMRAWMGRAVDQPTSLLLPGLLPLANIRFFGLRPEPYTVLNRDVFLAKLVDPFGGLPPFINGVPVNGDRRKPIKFFYKDAYPETHPIAYWQLYRTLSDVAWQKGILEWDPMREVVTRLEKTWPEVKAKLNDVQRKDLGMDAKKALTKALNDDPVAAWILLAGPEVKHHGLEGINLSVFYPSLDRLKNLRLRGVSHQNAFDYVFERLQTDFRTDTEDSLTFIANIIFNDPGMTAIIKRDLHKHVIDLDEVKQWLTKPL